MTETELGPELRLTEIYTMQGMLGLLWFGPAVPIGLSSRCAGAWGIPGSGQRSASIDRPRSGAGRRNSGRRPTAARRTSNSSTLGAIAAVDLASPNVAPPRSWRSAQPLLWRRVAFSLRLALPTAVSLALLHAGDAVSQVRRRGRPGAAPFLLIWLGRRRLPAETSHVTSSSWPTDTAMSRFCPARGMDVRQRLAARSPTGLCRCSDTPGRRAASAVGSADANCCGTGCVEQRRKSAVVRRSGR